MKVPGIFVLVASMAAAATAAADPVADTFHARCVSENSYQMPPGELEGACACMAPVMVSFLADDARRRIEQAIRDNKPVSLPGNPFRGDPADLARSAIKQCPAVGEAMYRRQCAGGNETAPHCREMRGMLGPSE